MFSFEQQGKVLAKILQKPTNKKCADCALSTPSWASLDFGVFVCSNCSGAHRALGPTQTRIKSTTLDRWSHDWVDNMLLGNTELNKFWEADSEAANKKKPKMGVSLEEHNRFVHDKYIKKKFVQDRTVQHPLQAYKNRKFKNQQIQIPAKKNNEAPIITNPPTLPKVSQNFNLLDDEEVPQQFIDSNNAAKSNISEPDDQFDDYVEAVAPQNVCQVKSNEPGQISFDDLFKQQNKVNDHQGQFACQNGQHQQKNFHPFQHQQYGMPVHQNNHMNMNGMNGHVNYFQPHLQRHQSAMPGQNSWQHNPNLGYLPHPAPNQYSNFNLN